MPPYVITGYWITGYAEGDVAGVLLPTPAHVVLRPNTDLMVQISTDVRIRPTPAGVRLRPVVPTVLHEALVVDFLAPTTARVRLRPAPGVRIDQGRLARIEAIAFSVLQAVAQDFVAGDWLLEAPTIGLAISDRFEPDTTWEHRYLRINDVEVSVPPGGGLARVNNLSVELIEDNTGQSLRNLWHATRLLHGQPISLKVLLRDEPYDNAVAVFTGEIEQVVLHDGTAEVLASDISLTRNVLVPKTIIEATEFPRAATDAIGRALPLVFGAGSAVSIAPLLLTDTTNLIYQAAGHPFARVSTIYGVFARDTNTLAVVSGFALALPSEAGLQLSALPQQLRFGRDVGELTVTSSTNVTNPAALIDTISTTLATFSTEATGSATLQMSVSFPGITPLAAPQHTLTITFENHGRGSGSTPATTAQLIVGQYNSAGSAVNAAVIQSPVFRHETKRDDPLQGSITLAPGDTLQFDLAIRSELASSLLSAGEVYEIGELTAELALTAGGNEIPLYLVSAWDGRVDNASGAVTGAPNLLLRSFPDAARSVLLLDMETPEVDAGGFSQARTLRQGWYCDGGIGAEWSQEQMTSRDLLDTFARLGAMYIYPNFDGNWTCRPYEIDADPVEFFDQTSILYEADAQRITGGGAQSHPASRRSTFQVRFGDLSQVYHDFQLRYAYNAATSKYEKSRFCNDAGTNSVHANFLAMFALCLNSRDRYGKRAPYILEAPFIYDDLTADNLLHHLVRYFHSQRLICEWETSMRAIHLEIGSFVTITHPHLPPDDDGQAFEVHTIRYRPSYGRIALMASRLAELPSGQWFALRDQDNVTWYYWFDQDGVLTRGFQAPVVAGIPMTGVTDVPAPHWFRLHDEANDIWYLFPATDQGTLTTSPNQPLTGAGLDVGTQTPTVRAVRTATQYHLSMFGGGMYAVLEP